MVKRVHKVNGYYHINNHKYSVLIGKKQRYGMEQHIKLQEDSRRTPGGPQENPGRSKGSPGSTGMVKAKMLNKRGFLYEKWTY